MNNTNMKHLKLYENFETEDNIETISEILYPFEDNNITTDIYLSSYGSDDKCYIINIGSHNEWSNTFSIKDYKPILKSLFKYLENNNYNILEINAYSQEWHPHEVCPNCGSDSEDGGSISDIQDEQQYDVNGQYDYRCDDCGHEGSNSDFVKDWHSLTKEELTTNPIDDDLYCLNIFIEI